jgi:alpha-methylacyl-CoA racemase
MSGPLNGVRVIELTAIGPVPFAGALLADLGADVVRIDRKPGSGLASDKPAQLDFYNRNKRSLALDLKQPSAVQAVLKMLGQAEVLLEGYRPGVAERLGLGPAACHAANPRLVYGRMTGWGQDGPLAQEAGHDINYLALTGALHAIGGPGRPPAPPLNLVADLGGGAMYLAVGVLSAVLEARRSGMGQVVDAAMVDGVANLMSAFQAYRQQGEWTGRRGENIVDGGAPYFGTYQTLDGEYVAVGAMEPQFYANLLAVLGLDAASLPAQNDRAAWPALRDRFGEVFRTRTRAQWELAFAGREACFAPVLSIDEAWAHPHMRARGTFSAFDGVTHPTPAPRFSRTPGELRRRAPEPGQHSLEVLAEWGFSPDEMARLHDSGAVHQRATSDPKGTLA